LSGATLPTSIDVARAAGVSQATVSRALRGHEFVARETRERIATIARDMDYVVDQKAAGLRRQNTRTIALVVICRPESSSGSTNPFHLCLLRSIAAAASGKGYELLISFQDTKENFRSDFVKARLADALIVIGTTMNEPAWAHFRKAHDRGERFICWGSPGDPFDWIRSDNEAAGQIAANHLLARGCRNVAFLGSLNSPQQQFDERFNGFAKTLKYAGVEPLVVEPSQSSDREQQGFEAVENLIENGTRCDGIFAACDLMAFGGLRALKRSGKHVPDDVVIIGFDGIAAGQFCEFGLTTVQPDMDAAGQLLVARALGEVGQCTSTNRVPVRLQAARHQSTGNEPRFSVFAP
jgi:DNA-binding LacI/PurR family transcriptional regulator